MGEEGWAAGEDEAVICGSHLYGDSAEFIHKGGVHKGGDFGEGFLERKRERENGFRFEDYEYHDAHSFLYPVDGCSLMGFTDIYIYIFDMRLFFPFITASAQSVRIVRFLLPSTDNFTSTVHIFSYRISWHVFQFNLIGLSLLFS